MKIFIACPAFGMQMNAQTAASLFALAQVLTQWGVPAGFTAQTNPCIEDLRNGMATVWYDCLDATHLLFVDADMQFEADLVMDMLAADKPLIGGIYPKKRQPIEWVASALTPPAKPEGNLLELEGLGCGVMLIRKDCVDQIIEAGQVEIDDDPQGVIGGLIRPHGGTRALHLFDRIKDGNRRLSEDLSFCYRYRASGGKVYAVLGHTICHLGLMQYTGRYSTENEDLRSASVKPLEEGK
jgi:hypothetical protein